MTAKLLDRLKENKIFGYILYVVLWMFALINLLRVNIEVYDVPRQSYFYSALAIILVIIIVIRKVRISVPLVGGVLLAIGTIFSYLHRHNGDWGEIYRALLRGKYFVYVLVGVILIDIIVTHNYNKIADFSKASVIFGLLALVPLVLFDFENLYVLVFGYAAIFLTPISAEEWRRQLKCISIASYISCVYLYVKSFIEAPSYYEEGRYVGNFMFPVAAGITASLALMGIIYLLSLELKETAKRKAIIVILCIAGLFPLAMIAFTMNRASVLGILFALFIWCIIFVGRQDAKHTAIRCILIVVNVTIIAVIGLYTMKIVSQKDTDAILENMHQHKILRPFEYIVEKSDYVFNSGNDYSIFEEGSILNALDNFSSSRLTLWTQGIKTAKLFPVEDVGVYYPNGEYMPHVHCQYICMIRSYGYIGGIPLIIAHIGFLVLAIKQCKKDRTLYLMPYMWMTYTFGMLLVEAKGRLLMPYTLLVIFISLLMVKKKEEL